MYLTICLILTKWPLKRGFVMVKDTNLSKRTIRNWFDYYIKKYNKKEGNCFIDTSYFNFQAFFLFLSHYRILRLWFHLFLWKNIFSFTLTQSKKCRPYLKHYLIQRLHTLYQGTTQWDILNNPRDNDFWSRSKVKFYPKWVKNKQLAIYRMLFESQN